jgi:hypothetical protein
MRETALVVRKPSVTSRQPTTPFLTEHVRRLYALASQPRASLRVMLKRSTDLLKASVR